MHSFRNAQDLLDLKPAWSELRGELEAVSADEVLREHERMGRRAAGGQTALNKVIADRLSRLGWAGQPYLFDGENPQHRRWKMDFLKDGIGVEVAFNHAEAVPWIFTRLNLAGESDEVMEASRIAVGVAAFATEQLKAWARMDSAVGTYELACEWLRMMRPIMPVPILVVGLDADGWPATYQFRGTRQGTRRPPAPQE